MKWVTCHKCADYALVDDEDEPSPGAMKIRVPRDACVLREDGSDKEFAKKERNTREALDRGDKSALLWFFSWCFLNCHVVPKWAQEEFLAAHRKVYGYEVESWDEVFGRPLKKGMQRAAARRKTEKAQPIWERVTERHEAGEAIDKGLFDSVGKEFAVSGTIAAEIYYGVLKEWREFEDEESSD
jgi:hypothetical protein